MAQRSLHATASLHGHQLHYTKAGRGPVLVLLHGVLSTRETWGPLLPRLARRYTVIAPDLMGSGESDKPRGDYSLGGQAALLRDLLDQLGIGRVTLVGHSLGGGIAMQFAYLFPKRCERLVLVSSGGLGRELHLVLRANALPGAELVLPLVSARWFREQGARLGRWLQKRGVQGSLDTRELWRSYLSLGDPEVRRSFIATVHGVVDRGGQMVSALNRLHKIEALPTLIVWGARDRMIPLKHGINAYRALPRSRLEIFPDAGHFPHLAEPDRFIQVLDEFIGLPRAPRRRKPRPVLLPAESEEQTEPAPPAP